MLKTSAVCILLAACGSTTPPPSDPDQVVANGRGGETTAAAGPTRELPAQTPVKPGGYGTESPTFLRDFDRVSSKWMALCQARKDTDGDGTVEVKVGHHGDLYGDAMQLYLVIDGGEGTQIDSLVDTSLDHRWVAVVRGAALELVDTHTRGVFELKDADVESDRRPGAAHRAARFATDSLLYIRHRDKHDALVIHDLATHTEREVTLADRIWRFGLADRIAELYTIPRGSDFPRLDTTLGEGECLGPAMSWSSYGQSGPKPTERWIDLTKGVEIKKPAQPLAEPPRVQPARAVDIPNDQGPAYWK